MPSTTFWPASQRPVRHTRSSDGSSRRFVSGQKSRVANYKGEITAMNASIRTGLNHRMTRRAGFGLAAAALTAGLAPAARADGGEDDDEYHTAKAVYRALSYLDAPDDSGGFRADLSMVYPGHAYGATFEPYGELLHIRGLQSETAAEVELRVYHSADAEGYPYGELDRDRFSSSQTQRTFNLGTPDGSGNIKEGRWVAIRMKLDLHDYWSPWAYGMA